MQRTRLSTLIESASDQLSRWLFNPWRRLSLIIIGLLFGNFFGVAISSIAGQEAELDIVVAAVLLVSVEVISWLVYRRPQRGEKRQLGLFLEVANALKIGMTYSLFVEAFKLGS
jgi:prepilin signal peptidase PulO-like enzyme (type II secretory pathway)